MANLIEIVPVRDLAGLASHCDVAFSVPCELKIRVEAWDPTSSTPLGVYTVVWLVLSVEMRISISCDSLSIALSRWSISVAAVGSVIFNPCSCVLISAIWAIASFA